jgi:hypothetical protein
MLIRTLISLCRHTEKNVEILPFTYLDKNNWHANFRVDKLVKENFAFWALGVGCMLA